MLSVVVMMAGYIWLLGAMYNYMHTYVATVTDVGVIY